MKRGALTEAPPLTLTRNGSGYRLAGQLGSLDIDSLEPLSPAAVVRYVRMFAPVALVVDLPDGDDLAEDAVAAAAGRGAR